MADCTLDHLVVAADALERGCDHVERCLGIRPAAGGRHEHLGTHNALLRLGPATYIEVIAIDPEAPDPEVPRWFGLDDPAVRDALTESPRLLTWVARSDDLAAAVAACRHDAGAPRPMQRGELRWQIAFPHDGGLVLGGLVPPLIEWGKDAIHPARHLRQAGAGLEALRGTHPAPGRVRACLAAVGLAPALALEQGDAPALAADIRTATGTWRLE